MSKDTKPPQQTKPSLPDGRYFRLVRGKGDYAPYIGLESLTVAGGVGTVKEEKFPTTPEIVQGISWDLMWRDAK